MEDKLNIRLLGHTDIDIFIERFDEIVELRCKKTFKHLKSPKRTAKGKSVP
jgi:hypothetical protein